MDVSAIIAGIITGLTAAVLLVIREVKGNKQVKEIKRAVVNENGGPTLIDMAEEIRYRLKAFEDRVLRLENEFYEWKRRHP